VGWFFNKKKDTKSKFKSRAPLTRKQKLLKMAQSDAYYSVAITRCGCSASSKLINKCFPFKDAPSLPLVDCDASQCTCEYQGLICRRKCESDRRIKMRRVSLRMDDDRRQNNRRKKEQLWNNYGI